MTSPRRVTYISPEDLDRLAIITEEDRLLAQRAAPKPLATYLTATTDHGEPDRPA